jgi:hypothetical protein
MEVEGEQANHSRKFTAFLDVVDYQKTTKIAGTERCISLISMSPKKALTRAEECLRS